MELRRTPWYVVVPFVLALVVVFFVSAGTFLQSGGLLALVAAAGSKLAVLVLVYLVFVRSQGSPRGRASP